MVYKQVMVNWITENFTKDSSYQEMTDEIKKQGMNLVEIKGGYKHSDLDTVREGKHCVMFLGSIEMTAMVRKEIPNCFPVAFCTDENYRCINYMSHFGKYLFNDRYTMMSLAELQRQKFLVYGIYGKEALIFIRPDSGRKPFQAQLLDMLDIDRFVINNDHLKHDLVVVSSPKTIRGEWRYIVTDEQEILGFSMYRYQDQITRIPSAPSGAEELVKELLKVGYYPDKVFTLDVCEDNDGNFWMMEMNSFSSAGLYASKKANIVKRVSEIAEKEFSSWIT